MVDNDTLSRESLLSLIDQIDTGTYIYECRNVNDANALALTFKSIDIIILKLANIADNHYRSLQALKRHFQDAKILIITNLHNLSKFKLNNLKGSINVIAKDISRIRILQSIKDTLSSKTDSEKIATDNDSSHYLYPEHSHTVKRKSIHKLTARQTQVIDYIVKGCSNKEIAYELGISEGTIKLHVSSILKILKVTNRTQAALEYNKSETKR